MYKFEEKAFNMDTDSAKDALSQWVNSWQHVVWLRTSFDEANHNLTLQVIYR